MISGFLYTAQLFSPNPPNSHHNVCVEMLVTAKHSHKFHFCFFVSLFVCFEQLYFNKQFYDDKSLSFRIFFSWVFFHQHYSPLSLQVDCLKSPNNVSSLDMFYQAFSAATFSFCLFMYLHSFSFFFSKGITIFIYFYLTFMLPGKMFQLWCVLTLSSSVWGFFEECSSHLLLQSQRSHKRWWA